MTAELSRAERRIGYRAKQAAATAAFGPLPHRGLCLRPSTAAKDDRHFPDRPRSPSLIDLVGRGRASGPADAVGKGPAALEVVAFQALGDPALWR